MSALANTRKLAKECNLEEKDVLFLQLATEEACSNAYEYCKTNEKDYFSVIWNIDDHYFHITVLHEGEPFVLKRTEEVNYTTKGRGLQLILNIMDEVKVRVKGNIVQLIMSKRLCTINS